MGKLEKQEGLNEYERLRNARIEQNKSRLQEFGIHNICNSLASLGGMSQGKKRKEKDNSKATNERDMEYIPDFSSATDEDNDFVSSKVPRKVTQGGRQSVRFIAPRSVKKYSHLARQRLELRQNCHDISKTQHRPQMESHFDEVQTNERQNIQRGSRHKNDGKMTMIDLILEKKQAQVRNEVPKNYLDQSEPLERNIEDVGTSSKIHNNHVDPKHVRENMHGRSQDHCEPRQGILGSDGEKSLNIPIGSDGEKSLESDDEILASFSDLESGRNKKSERSEDEHEQINLDMRDLELDAIFEEKTRGPTMLHHVHMRSSEKRRAVFLNEYGQPIGPITEEEDTVAEFSRFLGTIGRDYSYAPLVFDTWRKVPNKEKMWEYVLRKYIVPEERKDWVIKTIGAAWRIYKCRFKRKHYYSYKDDKTRWLNRSNRVPDEDFIKLLSNWKKKSEKTRCSLNRDRRMSVKNMHIASPKSFAIIREKKKNDNPNKEPPSLAELFERTRKRNEGKKYIEPFEDTAKKIEEMKSYISPEDGSGPSDAYLAVMGKENNGRRRLYGRGVCNKKLKKVNGTTMSYVVPGEIIEAMKANIFDDMRREMDEDHLQKKLELENLKNELKKERENMAQDVLQKILEKLPVDVVAKYLS